MSITSPNPIVLTCSTNSIPAPIFLWIKFYNETETELATTEDGRVTIQVVSMGENSTSTLLIEPSEPADSGSYFCRAVNNITVNTVDSAEAVVVVYGEMYYYIVMGLYTAQRVLQRRSMLYASLLDVKY